MRVSKKKLNLPDLTKPDTMVDGVLAFKYIFGGSFTTGAERQYEAWYKGYRVIMVTWTRRKAGGWGKGKTEYQIDGEKGAFKTVEELMTELNKRTLTVTP